MASVRIVSLNGGLGRSPQRGPGAEALWVVWGLKAFCPFSYKKGPKVEDLNENLPLCLRQTAFCRHDQP